MKSLYRARINHRKARMPRSLYLTSGELWTPANTSTAAWLDATASTTIAATGSAVNSWADKKGNGVLVEQATADNKPSTGTRTIGGLNVIDFDGNDWLTDTTFAMSNANMSVFIVRQLDNTTGGLRVCTISRATRTQGQWNHVTNETGIRFLENASISYTSTTSAKIMSYVKTGTTSQEFWMDSTSQGTNATTITNWDSEYLIAGAQDNGGLSTFDGAIGEIIVFASALSTADRQRVEGYLAHKWNLTAGLPASHPYKTIAPRS